MNLGIVWNTLSIDERRLIHKIILRYNYKYRNIKLGKIIFINLIYVIGCVKLYRKNEIVIWLVQAK